MNYCIVAFAIIIAISLTTWIIEGRRKYTGPQINTAALQEGIVTGMTADDHEKMEELDS